MEYEDMLCPSYGSLMMMLNGIRPSTDPSGTPLVTGFQLDFVTHNCPLGPAVQLIFYALPTHASTACLWGSQDGRQCWRPSWIPSRQYLLLSPHLLGQSFHHGSLLNLVKHDFLLVKPCWLLLMIIIWFMCLKMISSISSSTLRCGWLAHSSQGHFPCFRHFSHSPLLIKNYGQWPRNVMCRPLSHLQESGPQHSWEHPIRPIRLTYVQFA